MTALTNKLADLIYTLHDNNKIQKEVFKVLLSEVIGKPLVYTLTYVDSQALHEQPFLTVENATIQVTVSSDDLQYFIESCTAKGVVLDLI